MSAWLFIVSVILKMCDCQMQSQPQQTILPQTAQPGQIVTSPQLVGPASTFSQLFVNLLNYKLRWLSQVAGRLGPNGTVPGPGYPLQTTITGGSPNIQQFPVPGIPTNPFVPGYLQSGQTVTPISQTLPALTTGVAIPPGTGTFPPIPVTTPAQGSQPGTTPAQPAPSLTVPVLQPIGFPPPRPQPTGPAPVSVPVPFQGIQSDKPFHQSAPSPVSIPEPFKPGTPQPPPLTAPITSLNPPPQSSLDAY